MNQYTDQEYEEYEQYLQQCLRHASLYKHRWTDAAGYPTAVYEGTIQDGKFLDDIYTCKKDRDCAGCQNQCRIKAGRGWQCYWRDYRVKIGKYIITSNELVSGKKDMEDPYEQHTGIQSDWYKMIAEYSGIPAGWERMDGKNGVNVSGQEGAGRIEKLKEAV